MPRGRVASFFSRYLMDFLHTGLFFAALCALHSSSVRWLTQLRWLYFYCLFEGRFPIRGWPVTMYKLVLVYISDAILLIYCLVARANFYYEGGFFVVRCLSVNQYCNLFSALCVDILTRNHSCTRMPTYWAKISTASTSM